LYLLKEAVKDQPAAMGFLNTADTELRRVSQITKQTLSFHRDSIQPVRVSITEIINSALALYGQHLRDKGMTIEKRFEGEGFVDAFPGQLRQVFSNFIGNGLEASLPEGRFIIRVYDSHCWHQNNVPGVRVVFCDAGQGISAQDMGHIFEAFFTTKGQRGSGLGLWLSMGIINAHGGRIRVRSRTHPPSGTCFSLFFPRSVVAKGELSLAPSPAPTPIDRC
ncbi:MAG: HAMP domain-containing sensor histidine kinase, partial [Terriglobales bacterium]